MDSTDNNIPLDVIIIGCGISGIDAAYHVQSQGLRYTVLERRGDLGGTWDAFRFPGVRSDSDLYTMGFPFYPWRETYPIAEAGKIMEYLRNTTREFGIDAHIRFNSSVSHLEWDSEAARWSVRTEDGAVLTSRFVFSSTGYFDLREPYRAGVPGLYTTYTGVIAPPLAWPEDLDYTGKRVVVLGSGATAVTVVPAMAKKAAKTTMVQRTPTFILSNSSQSGVDDFCRAHLPRSVADRVIRLRWNLVSWVFWVMARRYPERIRKTLNERMQGDMDKFGIKVDPHFAPPYKPWDQRPCVCPDADLYEAVGSGRAEMVTGKIKTVSGTTVFMEDGQEIEADVIVPATGNKLQILGGAKLIVDGEEVVPSEKFTWRGMFLQDVPNLALMFSYYNVSWTTGVDMSATLASKIFKSMVDGSKRKYSAVVARVPAGQHMEVLPLWDLGSGYIQRAQSVIPKASSVRPWHQRNNWLKDVLLGTSLKGLQFVQSSAKSAKT